MVSGSCGSSVGPAHVHCADLAVGAGVKLGRLSVTWPSKHVGVALPLSLHSHTPGSGSSVHVLYTDTETERARFVGVFILDPILPVHGVPPALLPSAAAV